MQLPANAAPPAEAIPDNKAGSAARERRERIVARIIGLAVMSVVPAAFWTIVIGFVAAGMGEPMTMTALIETALGITAFLAVVTAAVTAQDH